MKDFPHQNLPLEDQSLDTLIYPLRAAGNGLPTQENLPALSYMHVSIHLKEHVMTTM